MRTRLWHCHCIENGEMARHGGAWLCGLLIQGKGKADPGCMALHMSAGPPFEDNRAWQCPADAAKTGLPLNNCGDASHLLRIHVGLHQQLHLNTCLPQCIL